jgi:hypothetical protein
MGGGMVIVISYGYTENEALQAVPVTAAISENNCGLSPVAVMHIYGADGQEKNSQDNVQSIQHGSLPIPAFLLTPGKPPGIDT